MRAPYRVPDPVRRPLDALVHAYKVARGVRWDDRDWDRRWWPRCARAAKRLLLELGSYEQAVACVKAEIEQARAEGWEFTLETIVRRSKVWSHVERKKEFAAEAPTLYRQFFGDFVPRKIA